MSSEPEQLHPIFWTKSQLDQRFPIQWKDGGTLKTESFLGGLDLKSVRPNETIRDAAAQLFPRETMVDDVSFKYDTFLKEKDVGWIVETQETDCICCELCCSWLLNFTYRLPRLGESDRVLEPTGLVLHLYNNIQQITMEKSLTGAYFAPWGKDYTVMFPIVCNLPQNFDLYDPRAEGAPFSQSSEWVKMRKASSKRFEQVLLLMAMAQQQAIALQRHNQFKDLKSPFEPFLVIPDGYKVRLMKATISKKLVDVTIQYNIDPAVYHQQVKALSDKEMIITQSELFDMEKPAEAAKFLRALDAVFCRFEQVEAPLLGMPARAQQDNPIRKQDTAKPNQSPRARNKSSPSRARLTDSGPAPSSLPSKSQRALATTPSNSPRRPPPTSTTKFPQRPLPVQSTMTLGKTLSEGASPRMSGRHNASLASKEESRGRTTHASTGRSPEASVQRAVAEGRPYSAASGPRDQSASPRVQTDGRESSQDSASRGRSRESAPEKSSTSSSGSPAGRRKRPA